RRLSSFCRRERFRYKYFSDRSPAPTCIWNNRSCFRPQGLLRGRCYYLRLPRQSDPEFVAWPLIGKRPGIATSSRNHRTRLGNELSGCVYISDSRTEYLCGPVLLRCDRCRGGSDGLFLLE